MTVVYLHDRRTLVGSVRDFRVHTLSFFRGFTGTKDEDDVTQERGSDVNTGLTLKGPSQLSTSLQNPDQMSVKTYDMCVTDFHLTASGCRKRTLWELPVTTSF